MTPEEEKRAEQLGRLNGHIMTTLVGVGMASGQIEPGAISLVARFMLDNRMAPNVGNTVAVYRFAVWAMQNRGLE